LAALVIGWPVDHHQIITLESLQGRIHLADVERPTVAGRGLELSLELIAVAWPR
jgi:hypothetical protein